MEQGSLEWFAVRLGKFTASTFGDLFAKDTTIAYQEAINRVVFERIAGESPESYSNEFMKRGADLEEEARKAYELETFNKVYIVGFVEHSEWVGGSPDGFVDKDGLLEIKVPKWNTLINYILKDMIPKDYIYQMQGNMFVAERQWCDFYVWHPKIKPLLKRINRDEKIIDEIKIKLEEVIAEAQKRIKKLTPNQEEK
jgi:exodeoxyribonuclease (lambda-induced)